MKYIDFHKNFKNFPLISLQDIRLIEPDFSVNRLNEWSQKNLIRKVKPGYYIFADVKIDEKFLMYLSNNIYSPSYVSLESAFRYYNLIPEGVYVTTAITTKKTTTIKSDIGTFTYRSIKPELFFGYNLFDYRNVKLKIADKEKLILDYLYLNRYITKESISSMRLNKEELLIGFDMNKLDKYLEIFDNKELIKRVKIFKNYLAND